MPGQNDIKSCYKDNETILGGVAMQDLIMAAVKFQNATSEASAAQMEAKGWFKSMPDPPENVKSAEERRLFAAKTLTGRLVLTLCNSMALDAITETATATKKQITIGDDSEPCEIYADRVAKAAERLITAWNEDGVAPLKGIDHGTLCSVTLDALMGKTVSVGQPDSIHLTLVTIAGKFIDAAGVRKWHRLMEM